MGWDDEHLNQFIIRGKSYGVYHNGGISFSDNARQVHLSNFQFRLNEKFTYEYNFFDHWEHEIRFEKNCQSIQKKHILCVLAETAVSLRKIVVDHGLLWNYRITILLGALREGVHPLLQVRASIASNDWCVDWQEKILGAMTNT